MKLIELSNHTKDKAEALRKARELLDQRRLAAWASTCASLDSLRRRRRVAIARARRNGQWLALAWLLIKQRPSHVPACAPRPRPTPPCHDELRWLSGDDGESNVTDWLRRRLDDRWTLLQGYFNRRGEIDAVLIGPGGLHAIEIKNQNGVFYCEGDHWSRDRYDNYGNRVACNEPVEDRTGRSPARQLTEPARLLQAYLAKPVPGIRITTHVLFCHPSAEVASLDEPGVDHVSHLDDETFLDHLTADDQALDKPTVRRLVTLVQRSHYGQEKARQSRKSRPTSPRWAAVSAQTAP